MVRSAILKPADDLQTRAHALLVDMHQRDFSAAEYLIELNALGLDPRGTGRQTATFIDVYRTELVKILQHCKQGDFEAKSTSAAQIDPLIEALEGKELFAEPVDSAVEFAALGIRTHQGRRQIRRFNHTIMTAGRVADQIHLVHSTREDMDLLRYLAQARARTIEEAMQLRRTEMLAVLHARMGIR